MGVWDLFSGKSPVEKASKQLREPYAQPEARETAMQKLFDIGTEEAFDALLKRFTFNASGQIADESEKRDLVERLTTAGDKAVPALKRYIASESAITFPMQALQRILSKEEVNQFLIETLGAYEPQDHRSVQAKTSLVITLGETLSREQAAVLVPYLDDHSDDVQFQAIAALEQLAEPSTKEPLAKVCASDVHAARVKRRAAQALAHLEWSVKAQFEEFDPELKSEWQLGKKGNLLKRAG